MGKTIDDIAKGICLIVAIFAIVLLIAVLFGGDDNGTPASTSAVSTPTVPVQTSTPTATIEPIESSIEDFINVHKSGQDITVECKRLSVSGNNNAIQIGNSDVEKITILGHGNSIGYSCDADPQIIDHGDYNDVWQRWLT